MNMPRLYVIDIMWLSFNCPESEHVSIIIGMNAFKMYRC